MPTCNICEKEDFRFGPKGRTGKNGKPPACSNCNSLERHRSLRELYTVLNERIPFSSLSALQISSDKAIDPLWFDSHELSIYEGFNSLDIQNIDRAEESYNIVICNHVLEHVENDRKAVQEMMRVTSLEGFFHF